MHKPVESTLSPYGTCRAHSLARSFFGPKGVLLVCKSLGQIHDNVRETKYHAHFLLDLTCAAIGDAEVNETNLPSTVFLQGYRTSFEFGLSVVLQTQRGAKNSRPLGRVIIRLRQGGT